MLGQERYLLTGFILTIPFSVLAVFQIVRASFKHMSRPAVFTSVLAISLFFCFLNYPEIVVKSLYAQARFYPGYKESALWAGKNLDHAQICIDDNICTYYPWLVYSKTVNTGVNPFFQTLLSEKNTNNNNSLVRNSCVNYKVYIHDSISVDKLYQSIQSRQISHLVLFGNGGPLTEILRFSEAKETWRQIAFTKIYDNSKFRIYKVD
jgi:hypothetical protein